MRAMASRRPAAHSRDFGPHMFVLGTAGHVDHGKSTLVHALTGIDPDRLTEEKRRGLTIDLGFAFLKLPADLGLGPIGLIDVPGHIGFIRNMLAGVSGIDAAILVVAADEGIMPQTREHLAILDLLDIKICIPVLTKVDAVPDPEWLALVELDFEELLEGTKFAQTPIWHVSAERGTGLEELKAHLWSLPAGKDQIMKDAPARLPIDRVFTLSGFGTVVTGTLQAGQLTEGDRIEILPGQVEGRVRSLQAYHRKVQAAEAGTRLAVNVTGISHKEIQRGQVLGLVGRLREAVVLDASFRLLPDAPKPVEHDMEVMLFHGSAEVVARLRLLRDSFVLPGEEGYCQLVTASPVVMMRDDRFIMRLTSPSLTLGGGQVLAAPAPRFWKRFEKSTEAYFADMASRDLNRRVMQVATGNPFLTVSQLLHEFPAVAPAAVRKVLQICVGAGRLLTVPLAGRDCYVTAKDESLWLDLVENELSTYHRQFPLRRGQPREELFSRLAQHVRRLHRFDLDGAQFTALMALWREERNFRVKNGFISLSGHAVRFSDAQQRAVAHLARQMAATPFNPPARSVILEHLKGDVALLDALLEFGAYVAVSSDVVFDQAALTAMQDQVVQHLNARSSATMADIRDLLGTSRKNAQALLEYMDAALITYRAGEFRMLTERAKKAKRHDL